MSLIGIIIVVTAFLALYWVFYGQREHHEMFMPKRKTKLKAVLFDLDGVLLNSFEAWYHVFNHVRKDLKLKEISRDEFKKKVWGGSVEADAKNYYKNIDGPKRAEGSWIPNEIEQLLKIIVNSLN